ncbi:hypothetical protein GBF38_017057 [Nibea albiflora]|uniref:Uncharacterized protein n=1 Tax=Nibea albiflora TaxID=240163 RepID=A0ACB7EG58_NIBAL|nr:hypothetical protein GBF38_017057 [Nibea albiflora]
MPEKEYDIPRVGPPRLIAYKPEPRQTRVGKVPEVESKQDVHLVQCDYCQQLCQPFVHSGRLENETDFERLFCCERAKQMMTLVLEERDKMAQMESDRKIDVSSHAPIMSEGERETAKEKAKKSMSSREYLRIHTFDQRVVNRVSVGTQTGWRDEEDGSRDYEYTKQETSQAPRENLELTPEQSVSKYMKPELEISPDNEVLDSLSEETPQTPAACQVEMEESLTNLDKIPSSSGLDSSEEPLQTALNICCQHCQQLKKAPVTSDQIAESADPEELFCCEEALKVAVMPKGAAVIAEETVTDGDPAMQKDQRVNLTPWGGTYCSDTGDLKKQWSWLDNKHHVHAPPCQPLCLTLSTNLSIRIQSQEHICITFTSGKQSVRLHVGAKLRPNQGKGLTLPGPDMLQRHLQQKSAEINVLLQNIQSLITYQKTVSPRKVKSRQSLISQMERRRLPMKQQQPAKKTP